MGCSNHYGDYVLRAIEKSEYIRSLRGKPISVLELGVFEGGGAMHLFRELLTHEASSYVGMDAWVEGSPVSAKANFASLPHRRWRLMSERTDQGLVRLRNEGLQFDVILIDAGHTFHDVLGDTVIAWTLAKDVVIWDDYYYTALPLTFFVRHAVDFFLSTRKSDEYEVLFTGSEVGVRKLKPESYCLVPDTPIAKHLPLL